MPATYAHYRMGKRCLPHLSLPVRDCIHRNRRMYDLGLHGPDFLFFHNPLSKDRLYRLASDVHMAPGRTFFTRAAAQLMAHPSEGAASYLYGVLAHFALDSMCHPFINQKDREGPVPHSEIEADLERHLLALDGHEKPYLVPLNRHLRLEHPEDAGKIAMFYEGLTARETADSFRNFRLLVGFCSPGDGPVRAMMQRGWFTESARQLMVKKSPDPRCAAYIPELMRRYDKAEVLFPGLSEQLSRHLRDGTPLGPEFDLIFG